MKKKLLKRVLKVFGAIDCMKTPEAIFIYNRDFMDRNFLYLTGLSTGVFENCGVLCERNGKSIIFSTTLEEEILRNSGIEGEIVVYRNEGERNERLHETLDRYSCIGVPYDSISHTLYIHLFDLLDKAELVDVSPAFRQARMIKEPDEIESIRKACDIADAVADEFPTLLKRGATERDLALEVDCRMRRYGASRPAFETIVAFSPNNSKPHYSGADVPLREGYAVLLDFGAEYEGYVSDITRTYLTGNPDEGLLHCYNTVLHAQSIALGLIADGVHTEDVEEEVKRYIDSHDRYNKRFIHGLGHSIGLSVHDNSYPGAAFNKTFRENMVLTVEPGIYLPGEYGIRIEDDILVEEGSCSLLTSAAKEPQTYEI
jgi:Xaa-Pro aminopeptidase